MFLVPYFKEMEIRKAFHVCNPLFPFVKWIGNSLEEQALQLLLPSIHFSPFNLTHARIAHGVRPLIRLPF